MVMATGPARSPGARVKVRPFTVSLTAEGCWFTTVSLTPVAFVVVVAGALVVVVVGRGAVVVGATVVVGRTVVVDATTSVTVVGTGRGAAVVAVATLPTA